MDISQFFVNTTGTAMAIVLAVGVVMGIVCIYQMITLIAHEMRRQK